MFKITLLDIIDIVMVAIILYQLYRLIRGTAAFSISIGIFFVYLFWLVVKALNMELISAILGQVIGVGVIALIIVFQQEIRRFLLSIGNRYMSRNRFSFDKYFPSGVVDQATSQIVEEIVRATESMAHSRTGALIAIGRTSLLDIYSEGGELLNALVTDELLKTIFYKGSPLHDGAVLIQNGKVFAARCPLPSTYQTGLPAKFGMRHRAAIGLTEQTDAAVIIVSEERGKISVADAGKIHEDLTPNELRQILLTLRI
ncbi:MAG TPA: diadenylate cyclase CdaA [Bacteroidales bacterium]|nr:diadenylate cyclase CdaA [Bacteroidales bacterium]